MSDSQGERPATPADHDAAATHGAASTAPDTAAASDATAAWDAAPAASDATRVWDGAAASDATAPAWDGAAPAASAAPAWDGAAPAASAAPAWDGAVPPRPAHPGEAFGTAATAPYAPYAPYAPTAPLATGAQPTQTTTLRERATIGGGRIAALVVAAALVGGAAGLGGAYAGTQLWGSSTAASPASGPSVVTVNDDGSVNETTAIAAKVLPSVVTIQAVDGQSGGTGSGVVLTADGYVVTNTHVVTLDGATGSADITVTTSDGHVYTASVVGTDPTYDLAVIKLEDATDLTPIEFGDSGDLNVGDETVAIGAPLGLANTVTTGIVSALNRSIQIASSAAPDDSADSGDDSGDGEQNGQDAPFQFDFGQGQTGTTATTSISIAVIQTDAAINPGNSGGALVDDQGRLIGVNVAIASAGSTSSGQSGNIGVGFSIPSDIVQRVSDEIIANGSATHGLLGATVTAAASVAGSDITGAYINDVTAGGAAANAGLASGDIVTGFGGLPITDATDLTAQVRALAAGASATITYVRDDETRTVDVTLGDLADLG